MGKQNVSQAFIMYAGKVTPQALNVLLFMANTSKDTDGEPWFSQGHATIAEIALGKDPRKRASISTVERCVAQLHDVGAISTVRRAAPRRDSNVTAKYRLHLDKPASIERPHKTERNVPTKLSSRHYKTMQSSPQNVVTEFHEVQEVDTNRAEDGDVDSSASATIAREPRRYRSEATVEEAVAGLQRAGLTSRRFGVVNGGRSRNVDQRPTILALVPALTPPVQEAN